MIMGRHKQKRKAPEHYVRCLGPAIVTEHWFWSYDKLRERICVKCRARIEDMRLGRAAREPSKDHNQDFS